MSQETHRPLLLVVDDEKDTNYALCLLLQRSGYRVAAAYEPYEANAMVQELLPDGVVLDLNMPAGGGRRFFDWMLANQSTRNIPVVVYSGAADPDTQKELLGMGARAFVDKSSPPDVLIATLVSIVGYVPPPEKAPPPSPPGASFGPPGPYPGQGFEPPPQHQPYAPPGVPGYGQPPPHPSAPPYPQGQPPAPHPAPPPPQPLTGGVPYPYVKPNPEPPPQIPVPPRGDPRTQQERLQEQLRVQAELQGQGVQLPPQPQAPPAQPPGPAPPPQAQPDMAPPPRAEEEEKNDKATLLLVDDSPDERFSLAVRLRRKGYTVLEASDGRSALDLASTSQPDVILSDVHMPGVSGLQLCQKLKSQEETSHIPVFIMSGLPQSISKKELNRVGGSGFFEKPIELNLLLALLQSIDQKKQSAAIQGFTHDALGRLDEMF